MSDTPRVGLLGGTFDPIHCGHLDVARAAREALRLDHVLMMPSHLPPHRSRAPRATGCHRFAMLALAVLDQPGLLASDIELSRPGPSFSAETLRGLHARGFEPSQLFFITGTDAFAEIDTWREYPALLDYSHFVVVARPGHTAAALRERLPGLAARFVEVDVAASGPGVRVDRPAIFLIHAATADVSSTEIRRRLAAGESLGGYVPGPVERYIRQHCLYDRSNPAFQLHG
jgi:nicotinate-nucleotide adenylyltransferase